MQRYVLAVLIFCGVMLGVAVDAEAGAPNTFFYTGPANGDFFDESNWTTEPDGTGSSPFGDPLVDSTTNAISLDLIIDGDAVDAAGQVDFGTGSLRLESGSVFNITGAGNDLDINANSTFSLNNAAVVVNDVINFEGTSSFSGGSVTSTTDDIAFQDNFLNLLIDGTAFVSGDNTYFDGFVGSIANANINSADRLGLRNNVSVVMTDTDITVNGGAGDIDDVFASAGAGSSLTLLGASTLLADSVEEGAKLILGGSTVATMGGQGIRIVADGSVITLDTMTATLIVGSLDTLDADYVDPRPFLVNGITGIDYATDSTGWNVTNWDGSSIVTLRIVPEPTSLLLAGAGLAFVALKRFR